jgi:hypothetical protein
MDDLDRPFALEPAAVHAYARDGFVHLRGVPAPDTLGPLRARPSPGAWVRSTSRSGRPQGGDYRRGALSAKRTVTVRITGRGTPSRSVGR